MCVYMCIFIHARTHRWVCTYLYAHAHSRTQVGFSISQQSRPQDLSGQGDSAGVRDRETVHYPDSLFTGDVSPEVEMLLDDMMTGTSFGRGERIGKGREDPGIVSAFLKYCTGTMAPLNIWLSEGIQNLRDCMSAQGTPGWGSALGCKLIGFCLIDAINVLLRGAAQVVLLNSPVTGLVIVIALYVQSVAVATYGMLGLVSSTGTAWLLGMDSGLLHSGLFGYNGILVGLCLATFQHPEDSEEGWDAVLVGPVVIYSAFSTLLFGALARLLVPYKVPHHIRACARARIHTHTQTHTCTHTHTHVFGCPCPPLGCPCPPLGCRVRYGTIRICICICTCICICICI